jgi:nitrous oxidase accessory protein
MYSNHNAFHNNLFENNVAGAALMYSEDIVFAQNTFARCRGFRAYGILYQSMSHVTAESNLVLDNSRGIFMNNADNNLVSGNDVVDNDLAIQLNGGCDQNRFVNNNFIGNLSELLLDVSIQNVFQVLESDVPEVRFYLLSPAAELLRLAEQAMPILRLGDAEDPRPWMQPVDNAAVPWTRAGNMELQPSPLWAGLFTVMVLVPLGMLARFSYSDRRKRRPGRTGAPAGEGKSR